MLVWNISMIMWMVVWMQPCPVDSDTGCPVSGIKGCECTDADETILCKKKYTGDAIPSFSRLHKEYTKVSNR